MSQFFPCAPATPRQTVAGDVVLPADPGEVVLLPRLWGFELDLVADGVLRMRDSDGLVVHARWSEAAGARLTEAIAHPGARQVVGRAAS